MNRKMLVAVALVTVSAVSILGLAAEEETSRLVASKPAIDSPDFSEKVLIVTKRNAPYVPPQHPQFVMEKCSLREIGGRIFLSGKYLDPGSGDKTSWVTGVETHMAWDEVHTLRVLTRKQYKAYVDSLPKGPFTNVPRLHPVPRPAISPGTSPYAVPPAIKIYPATNNGLPAAVPDRGFRPLPPGVPASGGQPFPSAGHDTTN